MPLAVSDTEAVEERVPDSEIEPEAERVGDALPETEMLSVALCEVDTVAVMVNESVCDDDDDPQCIGVKLPVADIDSVTLGDPECDTVVEIDPDVLGEDEAEVVTDTDIVSLAEADDDSVGEMLSLLDPDALPEPEADAE